VNTESDILYRLDGFNAEVAPSVITSRKNEGGLIFGSCFSSDSKTIFTGNEDNQVLLYDSETLKQTSTLDGHVAPVG